MSAPTSSLPTTTAFVLGAGLGTRLRPLTETCPKPLLPIGHKNPRPIITHIFDSLLTIGIRHLIINTHHCHQKYHEFFPDSHYKGTPITFIHEPELLDTGGGIRNILPIIAEEKHILIHNGDILTSLPLKELIQHHISSDAPATLALRSHEEPRHINTTSSGKIIDIRHQLKAHSTPEHDRLFTGIYCLKTDFISTLPEGPSSIIPSFLKLIKQDRLNAITLDSGFWSDIGTLEEYKKQQTNPEINKPPSKKLSHSEWIPYLQRTLTIPSDSKLIPIQKGGSDRSYYRLPSSEKTDPFIVSQYGDSKKENALFVPIARFLEELNIPVPHISHWNPEKRIIIAEDLGTHDLYALRNTPWETRAPFYKNALTHISRLHKFGASHPAFQKLSTLPPFDTHLYHWEQNYFLTHLIKNHLNIHLPEKKSQKVYQELSQITHTLLHAPTSLIHRDFQSHNIIIKDNSTFLIDFQGMRIGSPFYDLASLLYDAYSPLTPKQQTELLEHYYTEHPCIPSWENFLNTFYHAATQRIMQALGAFSFLGNIKKKSEFLTHIPQGLTNLSSTTEQINLPELHALTKELGASINRF